MMDKEARAREAQALLNNQVLGQALEAIEHGAVEELYRGGNDADARARIKTVREFKLLLEMAIIDSKQSQRPKAVI